VFAVIVLSDHLPGGGIIGMTVVCTVVLSVILHGVTANPLAAALAARLSRSGDGTDAEKPV
jgi:NhaP-type Na+/H+ or K+/H+ antiporter